MPESRAAGWDSLRVDARQRFIDWVAAYETAWRTASTAGLAELFTVDATYLRSPYAPPVLGLREITRMWEDDRESPDEAFTLSSTIVAVDGEVGVVRCLVRYGDPVTQEYTDLWVIELTPGNRCGRFEEWPFWPDAAWTVNPD
jgi:SnoaL-like domain